MKFPEFIIAGFGRAGTSALLLNLGQHPDIQIAVGVGTELNFWDKSLESVKEGLDVYKKRFYGKVSGEKTPSYCNKPDTMERIYDYIPNVKIILCLRNPVDRAISHFELHKRWARIKHDDILDPSKHPIVMKFGQYIFYLKICVIPFIPKENIYFNIMEWNKKDLNAEMTKIHKFLGIEPYEAEIKKTIIKSKVNNEIHYLKLFEGNSNYHIWSQSYYKEITQRKPMYDYYEKYNDELFEYLGYDIPEWRMEYEHEQ